MKRLLVWVAGLAGLGLVSVGVVIGGVASTSGSTAGVVGGLAALLALLVIPVLCWKVWGSLDAESEQPVPWSSGDRFATPAPERSDDGYPLSSDYLAGGIQRAGAVARSEGTVEAGLAVVRPALREVLVEAMVQGQWTRDTAIEAVSAGTWTDDRVAASVLDADVSPPPRSLRERLAAWLFPERTVRNRVQRAVQAIAEVADATVPAVPGQTAPRTVPVIRPAIEELQRGVDGELLRAADRDAVERGPTPPDPGADVAPDDADEEVSTS